jgi:RNA polymerase sigma factor (sigma-70 family)
VDIQEDLLLIQEIRNGRETILQRLYPQFRTAFLRWARAHFSTTDEETLINAYQEAMAILYENIVRGRITPDNLKTKLINYIIGIGNRQLLKTLKKDKKLTFPEDINAHIVEDLENFLDKIFDEEANEDLKQHLAKAWIKLSPQCQKCLELFYTHNHKISEIVEIMSFKDENTVSAHKSRCLRRLRTLIEEEQ